jgi:DNA repair protein RadC
MAEIETRAIYEYSLQRQQTMTMKEEHLSEPAGVAAVLRGLCLHEKEQEYFYVFFLDAKNKVKGYSLVTIGLVDQTQVHAREVFRMAILQGCSRIILAHNHPSGDCTPSAKDISCTRGLIEAGKIIGIEVLDHVIIGTPNATGRDHMSFRQENLI